MDARLGVNTGFAVNRFTVPEQWVPLVRNELGIEIVQFTADLLNASLPESLVFKIADRTRSVADRCGLGIESAFTSAFTRVNHLSHPDEDVRAYWLGWFFKFVDIAVVLGARAVGSHLGILTVPDFEDAEIRALRYRQTLDGWRRIAGYAASKGLRYLLWEPMSVSREYGATLPGAACIQRDLNRDSELPILMCLDVDHGNARSGDVRDGDPYVWLETFGKASPEVHIKQSTTDKGGHWPFTAEHNASGKIEPARVLEALERSGARKVLLWLEISFREREPYESRVITDLKQSVEYWRPFCR